MKLVILELVATSKGVGLLEKKVPASPQAPTHEEHPDSELSPPCELKSKAKQDKWPKKKPRG